MFEKIKYTIPYTVSKRNPEYSEFIIVDSLFEFIAETKATFIVEGAGACVIEAYESLNLPVAGNYILYLLYMAKTNKIWTPNNESPLTAVLSWEKKFNPHYQRYESSVKKLLTFI